MVNGLRLLQRPSEKDRFLPVRKYPYRWLQQIRRWRCGKRLKPTCFGPEAVKLVHLVRIDLRNEKAAIRQWLRSHGSFQHDPFLATQQWHGENSTRAIEDTIKEQSRSVARPANRGNTPSASILREDPPVAGPRRHHRHLGLAVHHGLERQRLAVWRDARPHGDRRSAKALGAPLHQRGLRARRPPRACQKRRGGHDQHRCHLRNSCPLAFCTQWRGWGCLRALTGKPFQLPHDVARGLPALVGILRQTSLHQVVELRWGERLACGEGLWIRGHDRRDEARLTGALERLPAGDHLVEHRGERKNVGARARILTLEL